MAIFYFLFLVTSILTLTEVHIIPHTHIDQGWLRTIEGYKGTVYNILNSVVSEMQKGGDRTFNWGEVYYFKGWYESVDSTKRNYVKHLIESGRFAFVHNGWIENDEACPSYTSIINQMSYGIEYVRNTFGVEPRVSWDIDAFGHDLRMVQVLREMGYDSIVINRVPYKMKETMKQTKSLEFIWKVGNHEMFAHTLYKHYSAPEGFDFENSVPKISTSNIKNRAKRLVDHFRNVGKVHRTNHILIMAGDDFKWQRSNTQYQNWDKLIKYINDNHKDVHVKYSTAQRYFDAVYEEVEKKNIKFPVVTHDFFQYMDNHDAFWSGFYSTHPKLKHHIRTSEKKLYTAETLFAFEKSLYKSKARNSEAVLKTMKDVREEVGVAQHHDAITGTSKKGTVSNYMVRLDKAMDKSDKIASDSINHVMSKNGDMTGEVKVFRGEETFDYTNPTTDNFFKKGERKTLFVLNSLLSNRMVFVSLISDSPHVRINYLNTEGTMVAVRDIQVVPRVIKREGSVNENDSPQYIIYFYVPVPGYSILKLSVNVPDDGEAKSKSFYTLDSLKADKNLFYNHEVAKEFSFSSEFSSISSDNDGFFNSLRKGDLENFFAIENSKYKVSIQFDEEFSGDKFTLKVLDKTTDVEHVTNDDIFKNFRTSQSGAYIFRPNKYPENMKDNKLERIYLNHGSVVSQLLIATQRFVVRFSLPKYMDSPSYKDDKKFADDGMTNFIKIQMFSPKIPGNHEIVFRMGMYNVEGSAPQLLTYNGNSFIQRDYNQNFGKFPIAGKYFPSTSGAVMKTSKYALTSLSQSSQAVSVEKFQDQYYLTFMIHRRLNTDDWRGMGEGNNDGTTLNNEFYVSYGNVLTSGSEYGEVQKVSNEFNRGISIFFTKESPDKFRDNFYFLDMTKTMDDPENVEVLNFEVSENDFFVFRVRNFDYSKEAYFDINKLFGDRCVEFSEIRSLDNGDYKRVEDVKSSLENKVLKKGKDKNFQFKISGGKNEPNEENMKKLGPLFISSYDKGTFDNIMKPYSEKEKKENILLPNSIKTFRVKIGANENNFGGVGQKGTGQKDEIIPVKLDKEEPTDDVSGKEKQDRLKKELNENQERIQRMRENIEKEERFGMERFNEEVLFERISTKKPSSGRVIFFYFLCIVSCVFVLSFIWKKVCSSDKSKSRFSSLEKVVVTKNF